MWRVGEWDGTETGREGLQRDSFPNSKGVSMEEPVIELINKYLADAICHNCFRPICFTVFSLMNTNWSNI